MEYPTDDKGAARGRFPDEAIGEDGGVPRPVQLDFAQQANSPADYSSAGSTPANTLASEIDNGRAAPAGIRMAFAARSSGGAKRRCNVLFGGRPPRHPRRARS